MALRFATQAKSNSIWKAAYDGDSVKIAELLELVQILMIVVVAKMI